MKAPACRLDRPPAFREARNDFQVLAPLGKTLVDVGQHAVGEGLVQRVGIERFQIALKCQPERRGRRRRGHRGRQQGSGKNCLELHHGVPRKAIDCQANAAYSFRNQYSRIRLSASCTSLTFLETPHASSCWCSGTKAKSFSW